jgi:hypothetical protein
VKNDGALGEAESTVEGAGRNLSQQALRQTNDTILEHRVGQSLCDTVQRLEIGIDLSRSEYDSASASFSRVQGCDGIEFTPFTDHTVP